jgi:riboflavin kinase / FMN adenylyltransferase
MNRFKGFGDRQRYRGCVLSIGNFDGVHRGHQVILGRLIESAREAGVPAVVLTFEPHPLTLVSPENCPPRLTTADRKAALLGECGVDVVIEYPTDWDLLQLSPEEFFERFVVEEFAARGLVEGPNFNFGRGRSGNVETLRHLCGERGMSLEVVTPADDGEEMISSSRIREALTAGHVERAASLLGRSYCLSGTVGDGAGRGRVLGFPTANLQRIETLIPADGVYAGTLSTDTARWPAAIHIGPNPTFQDGERKVEAHLLDFSGDLYGQSAELEFLHRVRETRRFADQAELQAQLQTDVARVRELLTGPDGGPSDETSSDGA